MEKGMKSLTIITDTEDHNVGHRFDYFLPYFKKDFDVKLISLRRCYYGFSDKITMNRTFYNKVIMFFLFFIKIFNKEFLFKKEENKYNLRTLPLPRFLDFLNIYWIYFVLRYRDLIQKNEKLLAIGPVAGYISYLYKNKQENKFTYENLDKFSEFHKGLNKIIWNKIETKIIKNSNLNISVGKHLNEWALKYNKKSFVVFNPVNSILLSKTDNKNRIKRLVFIGSIEKYMGLDIVISVMSKIDTPLFIIGEGSYKKILIKKVNEKNLNDKVIFLPRKDMNFIKKFLNESYIGIAIFENNELMKYGFTLKIVEYMACGLPVITTVGETAQIVQNKNCGFVIQNEKELIEKINLFLKNSKLWENMSKNSKKTSKEFAIDKLFKIEKKLIETNLFEYFAN